MKGIINNGDYTFDASLQTVTLDAAYTGIGIENILLITNLVDGEILYQFNNVAKSGTIAALVITLAHDTTAMADTDELMIIFDWDGINATVNVAGTITVGEVEVKNDSGNPIPVSDNGSSLTIDAASLPLPTGAATSANQTSEIALLTTIDADTSYLGSIDSNTGNGLARLGDIKTAVEIMDDWDESDRAKVNLIVGQAGISANAGTTGANTPRVVVATDSPDVTSLGSIADVGVITDSNGSINAKLRGLVSYFANLYNQTTNWLAVKIIGISYNSGTADATTQRVIIATDQPTISVLETTSTTIYTGRKTIATAGTQEAIASSQAVKSVTIKALSTNTGLVYIGNSGVSSTDGFQLSAGDTVSLDVSNLNTVYADVATNGEGITYIGIN